MSMLLIQKVSSGGKVFGGEVEVTAGFEARLIGEDGLGEVIAAGQTKEIDLYLDASALKSFLIQATGADLTVKTNNASTPDHTFNLVAGSQGIWESTSPLPNPLLKSSTPTDVTKLFVTNNAEVDARLTLLAGVDPTP